MSLAPIQPKGWIYSSRQFALHSDALSENIAVYRPIKETFDSRSANPIKIVIDSNSSFLRGTRSWLSYDINVFNSDGSANSAMIFSKIGGAAALRTMTVRVSGKDAERIDDYPELLSEVYQFESLGSKRYLTYHERYDSSSAIAGSVTIKHHVQSGLLMNEGNLPVPLAILPSQSIELEFSLNPPSHLFKNAAAGVYYTVSNVRFVCQLVTPDASYLTSVWSGITSGRYLEIPYVSPVQTMNTCSGSSQNNFILPLANARILTLVHRFRDDNAYGALTSDKSQIYGQSGLKSWRYQIGQYRLPLTDDFQASDAVMIGAVSRGTATDYGLEGLNLQTFDSNEFCMVHSFQSRDEDMSSALDLTGQDGNVRLITTHNPAPGTNVSLITTIYAHKTLLVGTSVDIAN